MENQISQILTRLSKSRFRSSFKLNEKDKNIIKEKGLVTIKQHAIEILNKRIKIKPKNDGKQTPFKGYPVFTAQHATACCCRGCLRKWYKIPENKILSDNEIEFFSNLITEWIKQQLENL